MSRERESGRQRSENPNRIVTRTSEGIEVEADQRHAEVLLKQMGLEEASSAATPGVKDKGGWRW